MGRVWVWVSGGALFALCFAACAVGEGTVTDQPRPQADAGADTGNEPFDAGDTVDAPVLDTGTEGGADSGADAGFPCTAPDKCVTARDVVPTSDGGTGSISGDTTNPPVSATGDTADWLVLDMTENDSSILAAPMLLHAVLVSPPGENFDLYVYVFENGTPTMVDCTQVTGQSTNGPGQDDVVDLKWGELGTLANGVDDSRIVTFEVRDSSTTCQSGVNWTLTIKGGP